MKSVILDFLVDFIYPKFCIVCGKEGLFLCRECQRKLPGASQICPMCTKSSRGGLTHEGCKRKYDLDGLTAVFDYKSEKVRKVVEGIKFGFNQELIPMVLGGWVKPLGWRRQTLLVPIPLHRYRENWRGFNQAEILARKFAGELGVELALKRIRSTKQQAMIKDKRERRINLNGCFQIVEEKMKEIKNKRIVLVDDVYTSGATMKECSKELKIAGAKEVWGLVLAR